jgi:type IV secretory pathway VirB6-like protein
VQLNRTKKRILTIIAIVLAFTSLFFAVFDLVFVRYVEAETVHYTYNSKGSIDYKVYLKPSIMFNEEYLGKDRYYVLKYIDYIDMDSYMIMHPVQRLSCIMNIVLQPVCRGFTAGKTKFYGLRKFLLFRVQLRRRKTPNLALIKAYPSILMSLPE